MLKKVVDTVAQEELAKPVGDLGVAKPDPEEPWVAVVWKVEEGLVDWLELVVVELCSDVWSYRKIDPKQIWIQRNQARPHDERNLSTWVISNTLAKVFAA